MSSSLQPFFTLSSRPVTARNGRPQTARPPSARPAAPRVRERKEAAPEEAPRFVQTSSLSRHQLNRR